MTLLIAENNPRDQQFYRDALAGLETYELLFSENGTQALREITDKARSLHLIIALWELPGAVGGAELLIHSRRLCSRLPIIATSAVWDLSSVAKALEAGAFDTISKPLDPSRLQQAILKALAGPLPPPEEMAALRSKIIGSSRPLLACLERVARILSDPSATVLLVGETGTGKELLAQAIHEFGCNPRGAWVPLNITDSPPALLEARLFGHERGAFTDARDRHVGAFEESANGTLFLDEIGELDIALQVKLLRAIQERKFRRIGGREDLNFGARLLFATNRNLPEEVRSGRFREDLYHRIAEYEVRVPPLRDRGDDIWLFVNNVLENEAPGIKWKLARETRKLLGDYSYPGNVRQLRNILAQAVNECKAAGTSEILPKHLPLASMKALEIPHRDLESNAELNYPDELYKLRQKEAVERLEHAFNRRFLPRKLDQARGNISRAATSAGLDPKTFRTKWAGAGLPPLSSKSGPTNEP